MQHDLGSRGPDLDRLPRADPAGWHRVEVAVEGDHAVLADVPQLPLGHRIRGRWRRFDSRVIPRRPRRPRRDDLPAGGVLSIWARRRCKLLG